MRTFTYTVGTYEYTDMTAFGQAWANAKIVAKELHCGIFRTVTDTKTETVRHEFYANGGAFLNIQYYEEARLRIF